MSTILHIEPGGLSPDRPEPAMKHSYIPGPSGDGPSGSLHTMDYHHQRRI